MMEQRGKVAASPSEKLTDAPFSMKDRKGFRGYGSVALQQLLEESGGRLALSREIQPVSFPFPQLFDEYPFHPITEEWIVHGEALPVPFAFFQGEGKERGRPFPATQAEEALLLLLLLESSGLQRLWEMVGKPLFHQVQKMLEEPRTFREQNNILLLQIWQQLFSCLTTLMDHVAIRGKVQEDPFIGEAVRLLRPAVVVVRDDPGSVVQALLEKRVFSQEYVEDPRADLSKKGSTPSLVTFFHLDAPFWSLFRVIRDLTTSAFGELCAPQSRLGRFQPYASFLVQRLTSILEQEGDPTVAQRLNEGRIALTHLEEILTRRVAGVARIPPILRITMQAAAAYSKTISGVFSFLFSPFLIQEGRRERQGARLQRWSIRNVLLRHLPEELREGAFLKGVVDFEGELEGVVGELISFSNERGIRGARFFRSGVHRKGFHLVAAIGQR